MCGQFSLRNKSLLAFSANAFVPLSIWYDESQELRMAAQVFPGLNASFCLEHFSSSQGWSLYIPLYPSSTSCCLSHVCMVSLTWGSALTFFPIVFLHCLNSLPSLPYCKQLAHPALLGRIINPKLNKSLLLFTKEEHATELPMGEIVWSKPEALLENYLFSQGYKWRCAS